jgi:monoamine oxidase
VKVWIRVRYLPVLQQREGRVFLAGSEMANGWCGFINGAIESGLTAARRLAELLQGARFARSRQ